MTTHSRPRNPRGIDATKRDVYIFGYGSLMERASRVSSSPDAQVAFPVSVAGVRRGWFDQMPGGHAGWTPTYLGAVEEEGTSTNGVVYRVSQAEFEAYEQRETGYVTTEVDGSRITFYDGRTSVPDARFYYFATKTPRAPSASHPIVQSYVDIVMTGAMEQEANYPLALEAGFVEAFVRETTDWSPHWINDRLYPYRPFAEVPAASRIDALLTERFPDLYPGRAPHGRDT